MSQLFSPFAVRGTLFRNRLVVSPMCQYAAEDGYVGDWHREHHARLALGGLGGAILEATAVVPEGRITPGCLGIWSEDHIAGLSEIVSIHHRHGTKVGIQLAHAGRKASTAVPWEGNGPLASEDPRRWTVRGPSPIAFADGRPVPEELTEDEIGALVDAFGAATRRAVAAGFDFVEIHGAHGYLIHSFLAGVSNDRTDRYGGTFENRMRLAIEVTTAVRAVLPAEAPLFFRVSALDGVPGGSTVEETTTLSKALKAAGVDVIDCSSGGIGGPSGATGVKPTPGFQVPLAATVKREAEIATMAVGLIREPALAEAIVAEGSADLVAMGRELLADSAFAYRAARELGLENPEQVLPLRFGFFLARRPQTPSPVRPPERPA